jgi:hypothetical protein
VQDRLGRWVSLTDMEIVNALTIACDGEMERVVLRGRPTLRTPEGERELVEGDVACFMRGAAGAHQCAERD